MEGPNFYRLMFKGEKKSLQVCTSLYRVTVGKYQVKFVKLWRVVDVAGNCRLISTKSRAEDLF